MDPRYGQPPHWPYPAHAPLPQPVPGHAPGVRRKPSRALIAGLALVPLALAGTCVGLFVTSSHGVTKRAEQTLQACAPSGDAETCARVTGTENDPKALEGIQKAVGELEERFGPFVSLSLTGICSAAGSGGPRQELSAEVVFEHETTPMHFRWHDDTLVGFAPTSMKVNCE